jgi:hypothetical protein
MIRTQILIWIDGFVAFAAILFTVWQGRPWHSPLMLRDKISRVVGIGIGVAVAVPTLMTLFDLNKAPNYIGTSYSISFLLLLCFTLPISLIAMAGSFISLTVLDKLRKRFLDKDT